ADLRGASAFRGSASRRPQRARRRACGRAKPCIVLGVVPHRGSVARGRHHRAGGDRPLALHRPANWPFRSRNFAHGAQRISRRISNMRSDQTGMPLNAAKILDAAQQREEKTAEDWLANFQKRSEEGLAKRAAEKNITPPPNEKALIEALAAKDHTEYDRMRPEGVATRGVRVGA